MKKFLIKLVLFSSPFIVAQVVELFVLPVDFFTFRVWESLRITGSTLSTGKFYPNMNIEKVEVGTLARNTEHAVRRKVTWITDEYGYRNTKAWEKPDVVIIGDSFIAGDTLSQEELLGEVLQSRLGMKVYSMAPANIRNFLSDPRFIDNPPDVLILQLVEQQISSKSIRPPKQDRQKVPWHRLRQRLCRNKFISYIDVTQDRLFKWTMLEFTRARVTGFLYGANDRTARGRDFLQKDAFFFDNYAFERNTSGDEIRRIVDTLKEYQQVLAERAMRFIFLPVPSKRNIYSDFVSDEQPSTFFADVIVALKAAQIPTVDLQDAFLRARQKNAGLLLYRLDDSHWSPQAVEITAESLTPLIQKTLAGSN